MDIRTLLEEFLLEGKLEDLQRQHSDVSADTFNHYKSVVPNTTHLDWVLNQHKKGNITTEHDLDTIFTTFNRNKDSLPRKQISQYKSIDDLHQTIKPYIGHNLSVKDKAKEGTETVYSSPTMEIKQHSNYESCIKGSILPSNNIKHDLTKEKGKRNGVYLLIVKMVRKNINIILIQVIFLYILLNINMKTGLLNDIC